MAKNEMPLDDLQPLDVRHGIPALAKFIRKSPRQAGYLAETGRIPAKKIGGRWTWSPEKVRAAIMDGLDG